MRFLVSLLQWVDELPFTELIVLGFLTP